MEYISAYPYASRSPIPTAVSFFDDQHLLDRRFNSKSGKYPRSEELEERIKARWGTVRYNEPRAFLEEETYVGIMREQGYATRTTVDQIIDALFTQRGRIDEITIAANPRGYRAILRAGKTTVNIEYDGNADAIIAHQYKRGKYTHGIIPVRVSALRKTEPTVKYGTVTEDIGVHAYGTESIVVSVMAKRKRTGVYTPENKRITTMSNAAEFIRQEFSYHLPAAFPTDAEIKRVEEGKRVQFTLLFKGYRHPDAENKERDETLRKAYLDGINTGIKAMFRKIETMYAQRERETSPEQVTLKEAEWFTEVYMKAKSSARIFLDEHEIQINQKIDDIRVDKNHRMYTVIARKFLGRKPKPGEAIVLKETRVYPTLEALQQREAEYLRERAAKEEQERAKGSEDEIWSEADIRAAQRMARG